MSSSERIVVVGGVVLGVASLVPWYDWRDEFTFDELERANGWQEPDALLSQVGTLAGVALALLVLVVSRQPTRPEIGGLSWGAVLTWTSVAVLGAIGVKFAVNMDNTTVGIYLALAAAVTQLYGSYVTWWDPPVDRPGPQPPGAQQPGPPVPGPPGVVQAGQAPASPAAVPGVGQTLAPAARAEGPARQSWPETEYLLSAWLEPAESVDAAASGYVAAFASDRARIDRVLAELDALVVEESPNPAREGLVATHAARWAQNSSVVVLRSIAEAVRREVGT